MANYHIPPQDGGIVGYQSLETPLKGPSQEDWERHKPLIKQLYVNERRKLKEVMDIMLQYGHRASPRTYKNWINRWGFDKKHKERDMIAIIRKTTQRNAIGKRSSFRVRGQIITAEQVESYFKRKKNAPDISMTDAPTPSDVSCRTPSPASSPRMSPAVNEYYAILTPEHSATNTHLTTRGSFSISTSTNERSSDLITAERCSSPFKIDDEILQMTIQDLRNILSENPKVFRSPSPPQILLLSECLFINVKLHIDSSIESGRWIRNRNGRLVNSETVNKSVGNSEQTFFECLQVSIRRKDSHDYVGFRQALSNACGHVPSMLRSAGPRALDVLLDVFLLLIIDGSSDVLQLLRGYIYAMTECAGIGDSNWGQICKSICMIDEKHLQEVALRSWQCLNSTLSKYLNSLNLHYLSVYLDYIEKGYKQEESLDAETLLRSLLKQCKEAFDGSSEATASILVSLGNIIYRQNRLEEAEIVFLEAASHAQLSSAIVLEVDAMHNVALCQGYQGKRDLAEKSLRNVIEITHKRFGEAGAIQSQDLLAYWLHSWGRYGEADALRKAISEVLGPDEIDLKLTR